MFFPWGGLFEQVRLADVFVHYDDVQFPLGRSFISRVQIKTPQGSTWLTAPVVRAGKQMISEVRLDDAQAWREKHVRTLRQNYGRAPFAAEMLELATQAYALASTSLSEFNIAATEQLAAYYGFRPEFIRSSSFALTSTSSQHLLDIVLRLGGDVYITGHGARHYLDHELFERHGVRVEYMNYQRTAYPQLHGTFDPHVTLLDLVANTGRDGGRYIQSPSVYWKEFLT